MDAALDGRPLHLESGADFRVDHVYVQDCVQGILHLLDAVRPAHDAYHIATGQALSLGEIVRIIRELVPGAKLSVGPGGYAFGKSVEAVRKGALDISRARSEFGYEPRFDIRRGLEAYVAWRRHETV